MRGEAVRQDCVVIWCKGYEEHRFQHSQNSARRSITPLCQNRGPAKDERKTPRMRPRVSSQQRRRQQPQHAAPAVPVHDGHQVEESPGHGQVGDVGGPRLVEPGDPAVPQQVGIDPMLRPTRVGEVAQFWRYLSRSAGCHAVADRGSKYPSPSRRLRCVRMR